MKLAKTLLTTLILAIILTACSTPQGDTTSPSNGDAAADLVEIKLSDSEIKVNGITADTNTENDVYIGNDIVYYEAGKDFTYGEGTEEDAHSSEAAAEHTVVHIAQPGTYRISGSLFKGQIAVDLGDGAKEDPNAVVTLILNGIDITCEVAPAVIFYNVYECGSADADNASKNVDTSSAGANVIIADGTQNTVNGSYVARIYKPDSVVLNEAGTEVKEAKKLHKYDAAFYSKMSMNVNGESENSGVLTIHAENEGLDSELHLTINGGIIHIRSGNDGINTNEDGVSVTTVNGGELYIRVTGETGEGDGIDSNGWLVINGGTVISQACASSMDSGIDSDMGIHINSGTVIASGNMLDQISESTQTYAVLNFREFLGAGTYCLKNADDIVVLEKEIENSFTSLIISSSDLVEGDYTLWHNDNQLVGAVGETSGMRPDTGEMPEGVPPHEEFMVDRRELPDGFDPNKMKPDMEGMPMPEGFNGSKEDFERNEDGTITLPDGTVIESGKPESTIQGSRGPGGELDGNMPNLPIKLSEIFTIKSGANYFILVGYSENQDNAKIVDTVDTDITTYYEMSDGTWQADGQNYKYRLEISGRMSNAAKDSTFVYLSNLESISFDQAWKAAGFSSNTEDYFSKDEAILVDWK